MESYVQNDRDWATATNDELLAHLRELESELLLASKVIAFLTRGRAKQRQRLPL